MASDKQLSVEAATERWVTIPGFEGYYEVSDQGRVRSVDRVVTRTNHSAMKLKGRMLARQLRTNTGYYVVTLSKDGKPKDWYVHRLVLMGFVGLPEEGQEACHENDIRTDNRLVNLRWDSHLENVRDAIRRGRTRNHNRERTHCRRGHEFTPANTLVKQNNGRSCRACRRLTERIRYHAAKTA